MLKRRRKQRSLAWQPRRYDSTTIPSKSLTLKTGHKHATWRWYEGLCVIFRHGNLVLRVSDQTSSSSQCRETPLNSKIWDTAQKMHVLRFPPLISHNGSSKYLISALCVCETYCLARLARKFSSRQPLEGLKLCQHRRNWCSAKRRRDSRIK